jgi:hypothetical protein
MPIRKFKLLVKPSKLTVDLLSYLNANIKHINMMGVQIIIRKLTDRDLDEDMVNSLKSKGVTKFPTLITDSNKIYEGNEKIINLFTGNIRDMLNQWGKQPITKSNGSCEFGNNPLLEEYHKSVMNDKSKDNEFDDDAKTDIDAKMREYQQNQPAHRKGASTTATRLENQIRAATNRKQPQQQQNRRNNIGGPIIPPGWEQEVKVPAKGGDNNYEDVLQSMHNTQHEENNASDDKMEKAWLQNNLGNDGWM